jgi:hypothetical protein
MIVKSVPPSPESIAMLKALRDAVAKDLDRKKRLGQYAVIWQDGCLMQVGDDAPQTANEAATKRKS